MGEPVITGAKTARTALVIAALKVLRFSRKNLVEPGGIEPPTS
jgi:hypothetical protein